MKQAFNAGFVHTYGAKWGFLLLAYANEYVNKLSIGQTLHCFYIGIEFTQSHRPKGVVPDSYDKCDPGLDD